MALLRVFGALTLLVAMSVHGAASDVVVTSFSELEKAVDARNSSVEILSDLFFTRQLVVPDSTTLSIGSTQFRATLTGAGLELVSRLFYVRDSILSLTGIDLVGGRCSYDGISQPAADPTLPPARCPGGAIFVSNGGELLLRSVRIMHSEADLGGAVYALSSKVTAVDCVLTSNTAFSAGGAIYIDGDSTLTMTGCTMTSNSASAGGAVAAMDLSRVTFTICTMALNSAYYTGGVVYTEGASIVNAAACDMHSNYATAGGAVFAAGESTVSVNDCTISLNSASVGGAVGAHDDSTAEIANCSLDSNQAAVLGGGVYAEDNSHVIVHSCTMISNSAIEAGGAVSAATYSTVIATNCAMLSNAARLGGALYVGGDVRCEYLPPRLCRRSAKLWISNSEFHTNSADLEVVSCCCSLAVRPAFFQTGYSTERSSSSTICRREVLFSRNRQSRCPSQAAIFMTTMHS